MRDVVGSDENAFVQMWVRRGRKFQNRIIGNSCGSDRASIFVRSGKRLRASPFRAFRHWYFPREVPACAFRRARFSVGLPSSDLSLIESGRGASQAKSHAIRAGVCDRPTERRVENASRTRKRTSQRHDKRNGSRLQLPPLPSSSFLAALSPINSPSFPREGITRNGRSRIRRKTKFPIRLVSAHFRFIYRAAGQARRIGAPRDAKLRKLQFNCKCNEFVDCRLKNSGRQGRAADYIFPYLGEMQERIEVFTTIYDNFCLHCLTLKRSKVFFTFITVHFLRFSAARIVICKWLYYQLSSFTPFLNNISVFNSRNRCMLVIVVPMLKIVDQLKNKLRNLFIIIFIIIIIWIG